MANRELTTFPFPPTLKNKLLKGGFRYISDLKGIKIVDLSKELAITLDEANQVLKTVRLDESGGDDFVSSGSTISGSQGKSAFDLLHKEGTRNPIITFSDEIDTMLGGGVPAGALTEFCGVPGIGKTQMGMQLAVDVHIPAIFGGTEGECIYIDTEGSFVPERVVEMAQALVNHLTAMTENRSDDEKIAASSVSLESILNGIHYYRIHHYIEQVALVNILPQFLEQHKKVRLLVLDSVTFHFRRDFEDMGLRTRMLNTMAQNLMSLADQYNLVVVLMNQVTTKITDNESMLVPALGESWGHTCTNRVILFWKDNKRFAYLYKSPSKKAMQVPFQVAPEGIRGINYQSPQVQSDSQSSQYSQSQYSQSQHSQSQQSQQSQNDPSQQENSQM